MKVFLNRILIDWWLIPVVGIIFIPLSIIIYKKFYDLWGGYKQFCGVAWSGWKC